MFDSYKPPGNAIAKSKLQVLKDSAILSLSEFNRIKQSSYFSPKSPTSSSVLSSNFQSQTSLSQNIPENTNQNRKTLNHKKKILDIEKKEVKIIIL